MIAAGQDRDKRDGRCPASPEVGHRGSRCSGQNVTGQLRLSGPKLRGFGIVDASPLRAQADRPCSRRNQEGPLGCPSPSSLTATENNELVQLTDPRRVGWIAVARQIKFSGAILTFSEYDVRR